MRLVTFQPTECVILADYAKERRKRYLREYMRRHKDKYNARRREAYRQRKA